MHGGGGISRGGCIPGATVVWYLCIHPLRVQYSQVACVSLYHFSAVAELLFSVHFFAPLALCWITSAHLLVGQ